MHGLDEASALSCLLGHLPLLNPGNAEARAEYMRLVPKVLLCSSEQPDYLDHCRQLLSLALVHPAFPTEDREALTYWLSRLNGKQAEHCVVGGAAPPPIPPRKIRSSHISNGANIIPILNGDLLSLPAHSEEALDELEDVLPRSLGAGPLDEEEYQLRTGSLGPGQGLFPTSATATGRQQSLPAGSLEGVMMLLAGPGKSATLPVQRTGASYSHSALPGSLEESIQHLKWNPGMKGETGRVCVCAWREGEKKDS